MGQPADKQESSPRHVHMSLQTTHSGMSHFVARRRGQKFRVSGGGDGCQVQASAGRAGGKDTDTEMRERERERRACTGWVSMPLGVFRARATRGSSGPRSNGTHEKDIQHWLETQQKEDKLQGWRVGIQASVCPKGRCEVVAALPVLYGFEGHEPLCRHPS